MAATSSALIPCGQFKTSYRKDTTIFPTPASRAFAIAAVLLSTGTAQRVVGVTTVSVTTQTATVTHTETRSNHTVETTTVTPPIWTFGAMSR